MSVHAQQPVCNVVRFLARGATAHDAMGRAAQILHQHDAQRDRDSPQFADGERLHALVGAHEPAQCLRVEVAVGVGHEGPGDAKHPRVSHEGSARELWQLPVEARRQILADVADLRFNEMVIVEQPFRGRSDGALFAHRPSDGAIGREQHGFVVAQPCAERWATYRLRCDLLCDGEAGRMLLETLDAEELCAQELVIVPGRNGSFVP